MRVLFLTQVLPFPLVGGAKIRQYYMLRHLTQRHEVTLVSFVRQDDRPEDIAHLRAFCTAVHPVPIRRSRVKDAISFAESLATGQPLVIVRDRMPTMQAKLRELVAKAPFDVIHADQTSMAQYGLFARDAHVAAGHARPRTLLDQHNALFLVVQRQAAYAGDPLRRWIWGREAKALRGYEAGLMSAYDEVLTVTPEDRDLLLGLLPASEAPGREPPMTVIPICVDPDAQPLLPRRDETAQIIHLGTMFWPPNIEGVLWFAREVLPLVLREVPDATFVIAGKNPPQEVRDLAAPGSPLADAVRVTGFVADPGGLLSQSRVFVVPLMAGGGMRVKIVDAWQWGLPLVSTTIGAEGIQVRDGENILLADTPESFAAAVTRVLGDRALARTLRENGRQWVKTHYDWRTAYMAIDEVYQRLDV